MQHGGDAIQKLFAGLDIAAGDVAPGDCEAKGGTRLCGGPSSGGVAGDAVTALTAMALGDVEGDGAQSPPKLLAEIAVSRPDASDDWTEDLDGFDGDTECVELMTGGGGRFGLHAPPPAKEA
jgi:hypothetical protein